MHRLAAISDGIFAVAMTLLVLDLHVPALQLLHAQHALWAPGTAGGESRLWHALLGLAPHLGVFVLGFLTLGMFWLGQQAQLDHLARGDRHLTWIHLTFLCAVSLMPFSTACGTTRATVHALPRVEGSAGPILAGPAAAQGTPAGNGPTLSADGPITGLSSRQILARARDAMDGVTSFRVTGSVSSGGDTVKLDLTADAQGDCQGTLGLDSKGTMEIRHTAADTWIRPDAAFWSAIAAEEGESQGGARAAKLFKDHYLHAPASDGKLKDLADLCDLVNQLSAAVNPAKAGTKGTVNTVDGVSTVAVQDYDESGSSVMLYVATQGTPYVIRLADTGGDSDQLDLADFDKPVAVQAPPADQVIEFSQFDQQLKRV